MMILLAVSYSQSAIGATATGTQMQHFILYFSICNPQRNGRIERSRGKFSPANSQRTQIAELGMWKCCTERCSMVRYIVLLPLLTTLYFKTVRHFHMFKTPILTLSILELWANHVLKRRDNSKQFQAK